MSDLHKKLVFCLQQDDRDFLITSDVTVLLMSTLVHENTDLL